MPIVWGTPCMFLLFLFYSFIIAFSLSTSNPKKNKMSFCLDPTVLAPTLAWPTTPFLREGTFNSFFHCITFFLLFVTPDDKADDIKWPFLKLHHRLTNLQDISPLFWLRGTRYKLVQVIHDKNQHLFVRSRKKVGTFGI